MSVQFPAVPKGSGGHVKLTSIPYDSLKLRFRSTPTPIKQDSPYGWVPLLRYVTFCSLEAGTILCVPSPRLAVSVSTGLWYLFYNLSKINRSEVHIDSKEEYLTLWCHQPYPSQFWSTTAITPCMNDRSLTATTPCMDTRSPTAIIHCTDTGHTQLLLPR